MLLFLLPTGGDYYSLLWKCLWVTTLLLQEGFFRSASLVLSCEFLRCKCSCKSEWAVLGKRVLSGLLHTGVESCQGTIWCQSRHLQSLLVPAALLGSSSKFHFHTEGQESLFGTQSVINIPLFPSPSKGVTTSQSLSICACTPVSLWKLLHKWHTLPSAPRESLQTGTWKTSYTCPNTNSTLGFVPCSAEIWAEGSCVWQEK